MSQWISVDKELPKEPISGEFGGKAYTDSKRVFIKCKKDPQDGDGFEYFIGFTRNGVFIIDAYYEGIMVDATGMKTVAWMPIPE